MFKLNETAQYVRRTLGGVRGRNDRNYFRSFLLLDYCGISQVPNLLLNGGFEEYSRCPTEQENFNNYVEDWIRIQGTPDYFNECGFTFRPLYNFFPLSGDGYTGIRTYAVFIPEGREFMMGTLNRDLKNGEKILVINNFLQSDRHFLINQHSIFFSKNQIQVSDTLSLFYLNYSPQISWDLEVNKNTTSYITYKDCFIAEGGEKYVTVGNFAPQDSVVVDSSSTRPQAIGAFTVYDDIKVISYDSIKSKDTTLCMLDSFYFKDKYDIGFIPVYRGDTLSDGFLPGQPGEYGIELHWGTDCGPIDTLKVTFTDCSSCIDPISEVDLCVDAINFNPSDYIPAGLYVQDTLVAACPGKYTYAVFHPHCAQAIDTLTITVEDYLQCFPEIKLDDQCRGTAVSLPALEYLEYKFHPEVSHEWEDLGMFTYEVISSRCQDTIIESELEVLPCDDCAVYVPNAFTPNRDGVNDVFSIFTECQITGFEALVYDRWGNLITESDQLQNIWDGKGYDNGVYVYSLRLRHRSSDGEREKRLNGTITLIR